MHGLIFETSICYWQDQPGRGSERDDEERACRGGGGGRGRPREARSERGGAAGRRSPAGRPTAPVRPRETPDRATHPRGREVAARRRHRREHEGGRGVRREEGAAALLSPSSIPRPATPGRPTRALASVVHPPRAGRGTPGGEDAATGPRRARPGPVPRSASAPGRAPPRPARDGGGGAAARRHGDGSGPRRAGSEHTRARGPGSSRRRGDRGGRTGGEGTDGMRHAGRHRATGAGWVAARHREGTAQSEPGEGTRVGRRAHRGISPPQASRHRGGPAAPPRRRTGAPPRGARGHRHRHPGAAAGPGRTLSRAHRRPPPTALTRAGSPAPPLAQGFPRALHRSAGTPPARRAGDDTHVKARRGRSGRQGRERGRRTRGRGEARRGRRGGRAGEHARRGRGTGTRAPSGTGGKDRPRAGPQNTSAGSHRHPHARRSRDARAPAGPAIPERGPRPGPPPGPASRHPSSAIHPPQIRLPSESEPRGATTGTTLSSEAARTVTARRHGCGSGARRGSPHGAGRTHTAPTCRTPAGPADPPRLEGERGRVGNERHAAHRGRRTRLPPLRGGGESCSAHVLRQSPRWPLLRSEGRRLGVRYPKAPSRIAREGVLTRARRPSPDRLAFGSRRRSTSAASAGGRVCGTGKRTTTQERVRGQGQSRARVPPLQGLIREASATRERARPEGRPGALQGTTEVTRGTLAHRVGAQRGSGGTALPATGRPLAGTRREAKRSNLPCQKTNAPRTPRAGTGDRRSGPEAHPTPAFLTLLTGSGGKTSEGPRTDEKSGHVHRNARPSSGTVSARPGEHDHTTSIRGAEVEQGRHARQSPEGPLSASPAASIPPTSPQARAANDPERRTPDTWRGAHRGGSSQPPPGAHSGPDDTTQEPAHRPRRRSSGEGRTGHQLAAQKPSPRRRNDSSDRGAIYDSQGGPPEPCPGHLSPTLPHKHQARALLGGGGVSSVDREGGRGAWWPKRGADTERGGAGEDALPASSTRVGVPVRRVSGRGFGFDVPKEHRRRNRQRGASHETSGPRPGSAPGAQTVQTGHQDGPSRSPPPDRDAGSRRGVSQSRVRRPRPTRARWRVERALPGHPRSRVRVHPRLRTRQDLDREST
ncbi:PREDICTED: collagen alpha-1(I) chain-like, partial [Capra hircus]|uniref:collagen alpha-1(I) chain-like n=1 Tax=Capra hircus TaxID=9925 RepID=UPI000847181B